MSVQVAQSQNPDPNGAADELLKSLSGSKPVMILFFASSVYNPDKISAAMKNAFPDATVMGSSTAGEIISGHMLKQSIVAMALDADVLKAVHADTIPLDSSKSVDTALNNLSGVFGSSPISLDPSKYVGIILFDGMSGAEERVMERIGDLTNIKVVGGSAGDDLAFSSTHIYLDGKAYSNTALLAILEPVAEFEILKTQSFCSLGRKLTPTKVDTESRKVLEFDGKPAVAAYAEALRVPSHEIASQFMKYPVGLMADGEPFVRSPQRVDGDAINFYCQVRQGVDLEILSSTDIVADTKALIDDTNKKRPLAGIINFHCILRTLQLEQEGKTEEYGRIFSTIPTIGFSTYGEEYIGHINQTATMLVFYK